MNALLSLALFFLFCAGASARFTPHSFKGGDPVDVIREIIYEANQKIQKEQKSEVALPQGLDIGGLTHRVKLDNVVVGKFDTIELRGDRQNVTETDGDDYSLLNVDIAVGLQVLELDADLKYRFLLIGSHGKLHLSLNDEKLRLIMAITTRNDGTCSAVLKSAVLEDLGNLQVELKPTDIFSPTNWLIQHTLQFLTKHLLPQYLNEINEQLAFVVENVVPTTDFEKTVCEPFVI